MSDTEREEERRDLIEVMFQHRKSEVTRNVRGTSERRKETSRERGGGVSVEVRVVSKMDP